MQRLQWRRMFLYWFRLLRLCRLLCSGQLSIVNNNSVVYRLRGYGGICSGLNKARRTAAHTAIYNRQPYYYIYVCRFHPLTVPGVYIRHSDGQTKRQNKSRTINARPLYINLFYVLFTPLMLQTLSEVPPVPLSDCRYNTIDVSIHYR